jgi:hypothetical protein
MGETRMSFYDRPVEISPSIDVGARSYLERVGRAMPVPEPSEAMRTLNFFGALDNFTKMFDIHNDDTVVLLLDRLIDPRVVNAIDGFSRSRGPKPMAIVYPSTQQTELPEDVKVILDKATFVVSTWFCSVSDPYAMKLRREKGQRWVKITYFRDLDLLDTPQARFPIELVGEIVRATAARYLRGANSGPLTITDRRGSDFQYDVTPEWAEQLMGTNRWRGELVADKPGAYVHYLSTHGPNVYERTALKIDRDNAVMPINGTVYPQWAVGFPRPFAERIGVRFQDDVIVEVKGESTDAADLREMLVGGKLIELGCGFNPKAPRHTLYPAGSNSPGALHFGIDLPQASRYIRRMMPNWEEPPIHMDLVTFDSTVKVGDVPLVTEGFLEALRDEPVVKLAEKYGDPVDLLEGWPE